MDFQIPGRLALMVDETLSGTLQQRVDELGRRASPLGTLSLVLMTAKGRVWETCAFELVVSQALLAVAMAEDMEHGGHGTWKATSHDILGLVGGAGIFRLRS